MHLNELDISLVGERLKKIRGNLSQTAFAKALGVDRQSIARYESGDRIFDANFIFNLMAKFNTDPNWLLTGKGIAPELSSDEQELLVLFRTAPLTIKAAALGALTAGTAQQTNNTKQIINGKVVGQVSSQNIYNNFDNIKVKRKR